MSVHVKLVFCLNFLLRCSIPLLLAGYLDIELKTEKVACNDQGNMLFMRLSTNFGKSIPTTAYQTFFFVPDSIKLSRACSSDVYNILRKKAELIFMTMYAIQVNR